jgi:uncharacterized protein YndB with AHSA1/START domain
MNETMVAIQKEDLTIISERVFDASPTLVWKALTDPDLLPKWQGPARYTTTIEKFDLRIGGEWRFSQVADDGGRHVFYGEFLDLKPNEYLAQTFNYEPIGPGHEMNETMELIDLGDGRTKIVATSIFKSPEDMEGMLAGDGMESGLRESYERLDALLASLSN